MRQVSTSPIPLKSLGLLIGLGFIGWTSIVAMAAQKLPTLQEYCHCSCGTSDVAVIPSTQPPNYANCTAMDKNICKDPKTGNLKILECGGATIVQRPKVPGVPNLPVVPVQPQAAY
jgi:hypothetical protein